MSVTNVPKLAVICLIIVCATVALCIGKLDPVAWAAVIGPFGGYLVGNGVALRNGQAVQPALGKKAELGEPDA
jgi:hypothetical protein